MPSKLSKKNIILFIFSWNQETILNIDFFFVYSSYNYVKFMKSFEHIYVSAMHKQYLEVFFAKSKKIERMHKQFVS